MEIGNPKNQSYLKGMLKTKPVKRELSEDDEQLYAEEHQISLKTNKGAQHMNLWVKTSPAFESDDVLDKYLCDANGIVLMFDAPWRYFYQGLPKFLIYTLHMIKP